MSAVTEILFCTHNRLDFTRASFAALRDNTNWDLVDRLSIRDDHSRDGTLEYLTDQIRDLPVHANIVSDRFGGPVAALNDALDHTNAGLIAKIDNDLVVCPSWLEEMLAVLEAAPLLDALGMEPGFGEFVQPVGVPRTWERARWIGGLFLARTRIFKRRPVPAQRFFGLTQHWRDHATCGWITPALPVFLLDHLPFEPWASLTASYVRRGWAREWSDRYPPSWSAYYDWWLKDQEQVA